MKVSLLIYCLKSTDGVCDVLSNSEIVKSICQWETPAEAAERLVDQALLFSCEDNATVSSSFTPQLALFLSGISCLIYRFIYHKHKGQTCFIALERNYSPSEKI